uniref:Uncharacterized protein n=1 Tax=Fagus sylvatica TaxID=28930 RepID=A0A2N9F011_FAGSY
MGLGLDFSAGFVAAVLVLKVVMGLGFVAAGAAKELVVVVGAAKELVVVVLWTAGAAKDLVTAVGVGGCWGTWLLPWVRFKAQSIVHSVKDIIDLLTNCFDSNFKPIVDTGDWTLAF